VQAVDAFAAWDALGAPDFAGSSDSEDFEGLEGFGVPGFTAESGRGLCLVDSFSDNWGWHPLSGPLAGKIVWALFQLERMESEPRTRTGRGTHEGAVVTELSDAREIREIRGISGIREIPGRRNRRP
jgi:hypothetical protein